MQGHLPSFISAAFFLGPPPKEGGFRKKPKVIWIQLHAVKIEFVARN